MHSTPPSAPPSSQAPTPLRRIRRRCLPPFVPLSVFFLASLFIHITGADEVPDFLRQESSCPVVLPKSPPVTNARIVGGSIPKDFLRSHIVSFHTEGCGASLISPRWAITAGHCAISEFSVATVGGSKSYNGVKLKIKAVHIHPKHDFPKHDVALIEFDEDAPPGSYYMTVNQNPSIPELGEFTRVVGYGHSSETDDQNNDYKLYQVDLPVVPTNKCKEALAAEGSYLVGNMDNGHHFCAGYDDRKCDSCIGDSGGPIFVYSKHGQLVQVGIISFGYGCARTGVAAAYLRLSAYTDWMQSVGAVFTVATARDPVFLDDFDWGTAPSTDTQPAANNSSSPEEESGDDVESGSSVGSSPSTEPNSEEAGSGSGPTGGGVGGLSASGSDSTGEDGGGGVNAGAIAGGVVGMFAIVAAVTMTIILRRRWRGSQYTTTVGEQTGTETDSPMSTV